MKTIIFSAMLLINAVSFSQIEITDQPGETWYNAVWQKHQMSMISKENLLAYKRSFSTENFQDTLRNYDWIDLGGYLYVDKSTTSGYNEQRPNYKIIRLDEGDTLLQFSYNATYNQMDQGTLSHTNFKETRSMQPVWKVKQISNKWFLHDVNNNEYLHLISYQNGVLIYDIPMNGKSTDTKFFSRNILMAFPKGFAWSKTSN
ncbi:MAG: hypothetical protein JNJ99_00375 [Crocinitomicaceae bacterium]|nr:hypothetical protein [Crocinitomicaceae bacterium]